MEQDLRDLAKTDVYLIDQILKGRIDPGARILDVGCGGGRNLPWFLRRGDDVTALDANPKALEALGARLVDLGLALPSERRLLGKIEEAGIAPGAYDLVISNAVLHFATGHGHFRAMVAATWAAVAPAGMLFARLTSSIGIEDLVQPLGDGRHGLPDGSERYLVDERGLIDLTEELGGELLEPIKSTVVQSLRTMTTWVVRRPT